MGHRQETPRQTCAHIHRFLWQAQYSYLFVVSSPTCFGQIYWPSSGSSMQQCCNLELSHTVTTVVFPIIKITQIRLLLKYRVFQKELYKAPILVPWIFSYGDSLKIKCSYHLCLQMSLNSELELLPQLQKWRQRCYVACGKRLTTGGRSAVLPMEVTLNHKYPR